VTTGEFAISVRNLTKRYGERTAVDGVTLDIERGSVYGLLGPNGAGKTTIVRILSTIVKPTSGTATVNGYDVGTHPAQVRKSIGALPEDTGLYDRLNAMETLRFYGGMQGMEGEALEKRIEELLRLLDLFDRKKDRVATYSRGMRQKLALARALIHDPPVLLLDEPTLGLDVMSTLAIRDYAKKAAREGKTVLLNTNNMYEAQLLCDRLTIISKGSIRASGTVGDLEDLAKTKGLEEVFVNLVRSDNGVKS
jgi:ABC-type multidrug transport system ATPase subunit